MSNVFPHKVGRYRLSTDGDLYIDEEDVIRQNISTFFDEIVWKEGDSQTFETRIPAVEIVEVHVNGQKLIRAQYEPVLPSSVTIKEELEGIEYIKIIYRHFVVTPPNI